MEARGHVFFRTLAAVFMVCIAARAVAAPQPAVLPPSDQEPFIGDTLQLQVAFDNVDATDTGYGPFLDLVLPVNGADGVGGVGSDGIDLVGSASYLGVPVTTFEATFPDDGSGTGCVDHPLAVDTSGAPLQVCGAAGDKLVTVELPFGSFVPDQPAAVVDFQLNLSNLADLNVPLTIASRAGFRFGATPLDDYATDPSILSDTGSDPASWGTQTRVTPTLITLTKGYDGPEDETATGPNYPRRYTITVDVAPGQRVDDLDVTDLLPANMAFLRVVSSNSSSGAGVVTTTPPVGVAANPPANELTVNFSTVTGGTPVTVTFEYFIPRVDADGNPVIDPASGDDATSENQARAVGDWDPLDSRDAGGTDNAVADPVGVEHTLGDKAIAVQKSVSIVNDTGAIGEENPGDTLEYVITIQVSDYFSFEDVVVEDVISDGQRFDSTFTPTLAMTRHGVTSAGAPMGTFVYGPGGDVDERFTGASVNPVGPVDGTTLFRFRVSDELAARSDALNDPRLTGGCVPDAGVGSGNVPDCNLFDGGATTVTLRFRTVIQDEFSDDFPSGDSSVDQGDRLDNSVTVTGNLLSVEDNSTSLGASEADGSSAGVSIAYGVLSKSIYKVNGADPAGSPVQVKPGDTITYRLRYTMPTSDVEDFTLVDYLPKPVFDAVELTVFDDLRSANVPAAGHLQFGPDDTFGGSHGVYGAVPGLVTNSAENSFTLSYGDYDLSVDHVAREIDILFTVTVSDRPFADGLFLTNQVRQSQDSTNAGSNFEDAIIQIQLQEPLLEITKGVSATSNGNSTISPVTDPVDGDLTRADAGDQVTFVVTVENTGHAPAYEVLITDAPAPQLAGCTLDSVTDGSGNPLAYSGDLFGAGLTLTDPLPESGRALVTLHCTVDATVPPGDSFENRTTVTWKALAGASETFAPKSDSAGITVSAPQVAKSISSVLPGPSAPYATVGDVVTYTLDVTLPEGVTPQLTLTDILPAGFRYRPGSVTVNPGTFSGTLNTSPSVTVSGQDVIIEFGDVTATASTGTADNSFQVVLQALVLNTVANDGQTASQQKINRVRLDYTGGATVRALAINRFVEPKLNIAKSMSGPVDAGDTITVTFTLTNDGTSPAYDIVVTDVLNDAGDLFDLGQPVTDTSGNTDFTFAYTSPNVTYTSVAGYSLAPGASVTLSFTGTAHPDLVTGSTYSNAVEVSGDGQDGTPPSGVQRSTTGTNTGSIQTRDTAVAKQLSGSSENWTTGNDAAIGEVLTFQLVFDIPEGVVEEDTVTPRAILTDSLPAGYRYLAGTARIHTLNAATPLSGSKYGNLPAVATAIVPDVSGQLLSFDLGSITNSDSDGDVEQIVISYDVVVLNDANNDRSDVKANTAAINYLNRAGNPQQQTDSEQVTIVEPDLRVSKSAAPATVQGNDTVNFTVVISNPSATDVTRVWDIELNDTLPARYVSGFSLDSAVLSRGNQDLSACGGFSGNQLTFDLTCLAAGERYLAPGESITVEYSAVVDSTIVFEEEVTNTASVTGTSLPGNRGTSDAAPGNPGEIDGERTGSGTGPNDIAATDSATVSAGVPTITKTGDRGLPIGGLTTMTLEVDLPVGSTTGFVVTDDLPAGLRYTGAPVNIVLPATDFTASKNPDTTPGAGTDPLVFDFGDIVNSGTSAQRITITYQVEVENLMGNQRGTTLTNSASLDYNGASSTPVSSATVTVLEPDLEITKTILSGATGSDAGDSIRYSLEVTNAGNSTAFGVELRDVLPSELLGAPDGSGSGALFFLNISVDNDGGAVVVQATGNPLVASDAVQGTTVEAGDTLTWPLFDLPVGATLTIIYDAVLSNSVVAGSTLSNTATASYTSLTGGLGRNNDDDGDDDDDSLLDNYGEQDTISFTVDNALNLQKNLNGAHAGNDFTIGDLITFDIRVDLVEGVVANVVVEDVLPPGLVQEGDARVVAGPHISYDGTPDLGSLQWNLGNVSNLADGDDTNDFLVIQLDARVQDVASNVAGVSLANSASVSSASGSAGPDRVDVDIVEPNLVIDKSASDTNPSLGDRVTYSVTVSHVSSGADAHDVEVTDLVPPGTTYVPGSHTGDGTVDESDPSRPVFMLGGITLLEASKSFTFDVTVDADATVGVPISNQVDLTLDGQPGTPAVERSYSGSDSETIIPDIDAFIDAVKTVSLVVDGGAAGVVDPGDTLEYEVVLRNTGSAVTNVVFTDPVPARTSYVLGTLSTDKGTVDTSNNPLLRVDVGDMASGEVVNIRFRVVVEAGTPAGTVISNQGLVDSDQTVPEPTDQDGIDGNGDQPTDIPVGGGGSSALLYAVKSVSWISDADASNDITAGDRMRYRIILYNRGGETLTNVGLTDTIPDGLAYVGGTATISGSGNSVSVSGASLSASIPSLAVNAEVVVQFDVTIDAFAAASRDFENQAVADSDQTSAVPSDGNGFPGDGNQPTRFTAVNGVVAQPALDLEKRVELAVDGDGDGLTDPGDTLAYTLSLTNIGSADALNVRLQDAIPANTTLVAGSVTTSQGAVVTEDPVNINLGTLPAAAVAVVRFRVTVNAGTADGTLISNQATANADGGLNEVSDDNGFDGDGHNPNLTPVHTHTGRSLPGVPRVDKWLQSSSEADSVASNVLVGEVLTWRVEATVPAGLLGEVVLTDNLPTGFEYLPGTARLSRYFDTGLLSSRNPGGVNSAASGVFVPLADGVDLEVSGGVLTLRLGSVTNSDNDANDERYLLELQVVVSNIASNQEGVGLVNSAVLGYLDGLGQPVSLPPVEAGVTLLEPHLAISVVADRTAVLPEGGTVRYTLVVTNPDLGNSAPAWDLLVRDQLPARFSSMTVNSIVASGGVSGVVDNSSGTLLDVSVERFPVDGVLTIELTGTLPPGQVLGEHIVNSASVTGTSLPGPRGTAGVTPGDAGDPDGERTGSGGVNDHVAGDSAEVVVTPRIDLELAKTVDVNTPTVGDAVHFTLVLSNRGPSTATSIEVTDVVPDGYRYAGGISGGSGRDDSDPAVGGLKWTIDSLPAGDSVTLGFDAEVLASGSYLNSAEVTAAGEGDSDSTPGNGELSEDDQDSVSVSPVPLIDLSLAKTVSNERLNVGETVRFSLTLANAGPSPATGVVVEDRIPDGYTAVGNIDQGGVFQGNRITWSGLSVAAGAEVTLSFTAVVENDGEYLNVAEVMAANEGDADSVPGDDQGDDRDTAGVSPNPVGVVGDRVWLDADGNGVQDAGESGVAGVVVTLLDAGGNPVASTTTDGGGRYRFAGVVSGEYRLAFSLPPGYGFTSPDQGSGALQDSFDSDVDPAAGRTQVFLLSAGEEVLTLDAGLVLQQGEPVTIGDRVWYDTNGNGIQDDSEPGIAGVTVVLLDGAMNERARTVTDGRGAYLFSGLPPGQYHVRFEALTGFSLSPRGVGSDGDRDSDADPANGLTAPLTLVAGEQDASIDAGMTIPGVAPAALGDRVWNDANGNGVQDAGEPGEGGVVVQLFEAGDSATVLATVVTGADGSYRFSGLAPGDYRLRFLASAGQVFSPVGAGLAENDSDADPASGFTGVLSLAAGEIREDVDAGLHSAAGPLTIGDLVWLDENGNGIADAGEGMPGVELVLYDGAGAELVRTRTDSNGRYGFSGLPSGSYRVEVNASTLPQGVVQRFDPDEAGDCRLCDSSADLIGLVASTDRVDFGYWRSIDLSLKISVSPGPYVVGDVVTFTLVVANAPGQGAATGIQVVDPVLPGFIYQGNIRGGDSRDDSDPAGQGLVWNINRLEPGESVVLSFEARVISAAQYSNAAQVAAADQPDVDSTPANDDGNHLEDDEAVVEISLTPVAIPTLGQWGLMLLSLLLLAAVAGRSRRSF